jgi:hypothetical protein
MGVLQLKTKASVRVPHVPPVIQEMVARKSIHLWLNNCFKGKWIYFTKLGQAMPAKTRITKKHSLIMIIILSDKTLTRNKMVKLV